MLTSQEVVQNLNHVARSNAYIELSVSIINIQ